MFLMKVYFAHIGYFQGVVHLKPGEFSSSQKAPADAWIPDRRWSCDSDSACSEESISSSSSPFKKQPVQSCFPLSLQIPGHQAVFINEPRLSDFKQVLLREGIQAEFVGGVLVCNNMVAVRRVSVGSPHPENVLSISSLLRC